MTIEAPKVGIREFRAGLADYIAAAEPVAVTRHGQTVGFFIPATGPTDADAAALRQAAATLDRLLAEHQVEVDAVVTEFKSARKTSRKPTRAKA